MATPQPDRQSAASAALQGWRAVSLACLCANSITRFDLYLRLNNERPPVLYRGRDLTFTEEHRERLLEARVESVLIPASQEGEYRQYVEEHLAEILKEPGVSVEEKAQVLYSSARDLVKDVLADPRAAHMVPRSKALVQTALWFLRSDPGSFLNLTRIVSCDYYTYTHSVNVFVFAMALAQRVGYSQPVELQRFGEGVLLHDIGKSEIDPAILNCSGKLSEEQWEEMKRHPIYGHALLLAREGLSEESLEVVRHHHEKLTGTGYPDGVEGREVTVRMRIATIADIFDALTTRRPYKDALSSYAALSLMQAEMARELDMDLFRAFVELMGSPEGPPVTEPR